MNLRPAGLLLVLLAGPALLAGCADTPAPAMPAEPMAEVPSLLQPEPKMEVAAIPAPPPVARFAGHVASYRTLVEAETAWPRLAERFPQLKMADRRYVEVDLGGERGKVVRLLVGGFADRAAALEYCRGLRSASLYCAPHELPAS